MYWKPLLLLVTFGLLCGCGSSPTSPAASPTGIVATGPQVLRILGQAPCTELGQGVLPIVYTRVTVTMSANEWVATAASTTAGDIQVHFRQSGPSVVTGALPVAGTVIGTAVHMPELFSGPAWDLRATFDRSASLSGTAFVAGTFGSSTGGIDGVGNGSLTLTDATGKTCAGTTFSWAIAPSS